MTDTNPEKTPHVDYDDVLTIQLTRRELSDLLTALAGDQTGAEWDLLKEVNAYTEADRGLLDSVWHEYYEVSA